MLPSRTDIRLGKALARIDALTIRRTKRASRRVIKAQCGQVCARPLEYAPGLGDRLPSETDHSKGTGDTRVVCNRKGGRLRVLHAESPRPAEQPFYFQGSHRNVIRRAHGYVVAVRFEALI